MRLPFLRSDPPAKAERGRAAAAGDEASSITAARTRARRRLVGALVLLLIGIIGFPILFETQPRPLAVDTPIEAPRGSTRGSGTVVTPSPATVRAPLPVSPAPDTAPEVAATPRAPVSDVPRPESAVVAAMPAPAPVPSPAVAPPPAARATASAPVVVAARAPASASTPVASTPPAPATAASGPGRFVVQVGAFTDAAVLRETRAKVEKLGLKSYTQVIENDAGKRTRVRLGPFATRDEATAAAARVKGAGLPANILAL